MRSFIFTVDKEESKAGLKLHSEPVLLYFIAVPQAAKRNEGGGVARKIVEQF